MPDSALSADSDRNRCTAGSERVPKENAGRRPTLERPRNLEEEKERLEEERRQRDDEWRREWKERRKTWQARNEREEKEEEEEREEEREREEARRRQLLNGLMLQQLEQNLVSAAMSWAVSYVDAAAETRAEALWRKRLRWWRHADASTADKSFKRKYRMDQSAFNKLVGILRPVIERDETFARELSYVPLGIILKKCYIPVVKPGREVDHSST